MAPLPLTRGGKLGLLNAFKSYEDVLDTRFPRNKVWLKYRQHSNSGLPQCASKCTLKDKLARYDIVACDDERAEEIIHSVISQLRHRNLGTSYDLSGSS